MLLSHCALKSLNSIEKTQPRVRCGTFTDNPYTTIVPCNSSTNASDKTNITTFYDGLSSLARHILKHNVLIISGDMNAQIGKCEKDKFGLHDQLNKIGEYQTDFSFENSLLFLNTKLNKRGREIYGPTPTQITQLAQLDYISINKKWINSTLNFEVYASFEGVSSDHRIVTGKIRLSLYRNKKQTVKTTCYDWSSLTNKDITNKYTVIVRNKFDFLLEIYENFVTVYKGAESEFVPTKPRIKCRVPWESLIVRKNRDNFLKSISIQ